MFGRCRALAVNAPAIRPPTGLGGGLNERTQLLDGRFARRRQLAPPENVKRLANRSRRTDRVIPSRLVGRHLDPYFRGAKDYASRAVGDGEATAARHPPRRHRLTTARIIGCENVLEARLKAKGRDYGLGVEGPLECRPASSVGCARGGGVSPPRRLAIRGKKVTVVIPCSAGLTRRPRLDLPIFSRSSSFVASGSSVIAFEPTVGRGEQAGSLLERYDRRR